MTIEEMWTKFTSEGGDYARTQYPLFKKIVQQACAEARTEALEKMAWGNLQNEAWNSALDEAAAIADSKLDETLFDSQLIAAADKEYLPRERDWIADRIRALKRPTHNHGPEHYCDECNPT